MFQLEPELIVLLVRKDQQAYNTFYLKTVDVFYRYVQSHYFVSPPEIEDMLSEFYVKFWRVVDRYDDTWKFETYLWTVFKNSLKDYFRKQKKHTSLSVEEYIEDEDQDSLLDMLQQDFQLEQIQDAMEELQEVDQEVLFFRYIEEKSYEEIADLLGISQDALRKRVSRSLTKLKQLLN